MLLFFTLIIAICGILYELLIGTLSSYLIGDSIRQFSFTIGFFMSGMGIGAYLSRYLEQKAIYNFLRIELFLSIIGSSSTIILKMAYIYLGMSNFSFLFIYFFLTMLIGSLVGIEIPLITSIYKKLKLKSQSIISDIFTFDYIGGLFASLLFPIILLPYFGLYNISIFIGILNLIVAILYIGYINNKKIKNINLSKYYIAVVIIIFYFIALFFGSSRLEDFYLRFYYKQPILESYQTKYQNIVLTKKGEDFRLYINGNIQFLSLDEMRYHEALVDWPLLLDKRLKNVGGEPSVNPKDNISVLVLGGGDGLAVRNLLKYDKIDSITLVDLDPEMTKIASTQKDLVKLNNNSLVDDKVKIINEDAFKYIYELDKRFDFIIADFTDPRDVGTAKLYSKEMYIGIKGSLKDGGIFVTQSSNAFFSSRTMFSINKTINDVFGNSIPYHRYLPSFGDWGFVLAQKGGLKETNICPNKGCDYFDDDYTKNISDVEINTLTNPVIIEYYGEGYKKFNL